MPVTPERSARFAQALTLTRPVARTRLYWTARAVLVSDAAQVQGVRRACSSTVFGVARGRARGAARGRARRDAAPDDDRPARAATGRRRGARRRRGAGAASEAASATSPVPVAASDEERLRGKRFDALEPAELAALYRLMTRARGSRRRCGARAAPSATAAASTSTCAARCAAACAPAATRSGSRTGAGASSAAGSSCCATSAARWSRTRARTCSSSRAPGTPDAEAFVFATRLTRITRALATRNPERAIQRAAAAAPDWSSGTRIGDALRAFNDRHGRRGMARGAVIVILSDGWERGEPDARRRARWSGWRGSRTGSCGSTRA